MRHIMKDVLPANLRIACAQLSLASSLTKHLTRSLERGSHPSRCPKNIIIAIPWLPQDYCSIEYGLFTNARHSEMVYIVRGLHTLVSFIVWIEPLHLATG